DDTAARELEQVHGHSHLEAWRLGPHGDAVSGRRWLLVNDDVRIGVAVPAHAQQTLYVNASADEVVFLHHGSGTLRSQFGRLPLREGDYAVIPRGTFHRLDLHPFDVIGWDGTVDPCALSVHDFEPRAGRCHVPPPTHQVLQAPNLVICNFVPRKVDWDSQAVALPYHHSNLDSDEVMYYAGGNYSARRGIQEG